MRLLTTLSPHGMGFPAALVMRGRYKFGLKGYLVRTSELVWWLLLNCLCSWSQDYMRMRNAMDKSCPNPSLTNESARLK
ncbi:Protein of unknown function [Pyronema omphalodes CBS 100304]|uniref:Uncharacterized protein n=1 Tax=Pyronema omphalodes (strain CBS 100304) TaxID=1076935 RepID=U4L4S1_PYROM|nr:Protein of unknown function [Pyronema omphalodes CBS 100304]